jgi:hypothetical protein
MPRRGKGKTFTKGVYMCIYRVIDVCPSGYNVEVPAVAVAGVGAVLGDEAKSDDKKDGDEALAAQYKSDTEGRRIG